MNHPRTCQRQPTSSAEAVRQSRRRFRYSTGLVLLLCAVPVVGGGLSDDLARLFRQADYDSARARLEAGGDGGGEQDTWETTYWRMIMTQDPEEALSESRSLCEDRGVPESIRLRAALEAASIHFARGAPRQSLAPLLEAVEQVERLPAEHYLLMGLCYWVLRDVQKSREAFATIPQSDPNFVWARHYLGYLGLESGDPTLALRYFESAERSPLAVHTPSLLAGKWEVHRSEGRWDEAASLQESLLQDHPHSLAALRIRSLLEREADTQVFDPVTTHGDTTTSAPQTSRGRFSLQLAAFADRSRALTYLANWQDELPDLRIDEELDPDHPVLYKIRLGNFVSRNQARTESERLRRQHGLEVLIVESSR